MVQRIKIRPVGVGDRRGFRNRGTADASPYPYYTTYWGESKMTKQKDGRYRAKVTVGHDAEGRPVYKYASGQTKRELEENKEKLRQEFVLGITDDRKDILFNAYMEEWYNLYKKPHLAMGSRKAYASIMNKRIIPALDKKQLRAVTAGDLQAILNDMSGMGRTTIGYAKSILENVCRRAYASGILDRDISVALVKPQSTGETKRALTAAETAAALKVGAEHPEGLLLLILYYTGLRRGEALGLQWGDVNFSDMTITVARDIDFLTNAPGELKTECSKRTVPMPPALADALRPLRGIHNVYILQAPNTHQHLSQSTYKRRWERLMKAMCEVGEDIESEDGVSILTPHYFRHNYASVLYNAGVDVLSAQKFMGHAKIETTLGIYAHLAEGREAENAEKVRNAFL